VELDREALDATIRTLRLTQEAIPARWAEDTADELLTLVHITFDDFVVAVLAEPLPSGAPPDGTPLAPRAALHARAIADLLAALAIAYSKDIESEPGDAPPEALAALRQYWIDAIAQAALSADRPGHHTAVYYVRGAAASLGFAARILNAERGLSLDPDDPRGPVELPEGALTGEDAGALLVWCASSALCIAATLQPEFRIAPL
jgi:hypothetical protein